MAMRNHWLFGIVVLLISLLLKEKHHKDQVYHHSLSAFTGKISGAGTVFCLSVNLACVLFPSFLSLKIETLNIIAKFWKTM